MPSEQRATAILSLEAPSAESALKALAPAAQAWRSALVATLEDLRGLLAGPSTPASAASSLGAFAAGRIDVARFTGLVSRTRPLEDAALVRLRVAYDTLKSLAERDPADLLAAWVPDGGSVRETVAAALTEVGRTFGAAREATFARSGTYRDAEHHGLHAAYPFSRWSRRERLLAPPLVLDVAGPDLRATDLVEFLDGAVKIVLLVRGPCAPAPLARLVTPGTFVLQTSDVGAITRVAACPGPAVAAFVPPDAAAFVHDPAAGAALWERMRVDRLPSDAVRMPFTAWSAEQQMEEVRQLAAMAMRPSEAAMAAAAAALPAADAAASADPAGRLAAWLLEAAGAAAKGGDAARG